MSSSYNYTAALLVDTAVKSELFLKTLFFEADRSSLAVGSRSDGLSRGNRSDLPKFLADYV